MADWDERYRRGEHAGLEPDSLLARALDLACGAGRHALALARHGFEVTAVDSSPAAVEILRERARGLGLNLDARVADLERGEFEAGPDSYDLVCDFYYLQRDLFRVVRACVRRGGLFVAAIHTRDDDPHLRQMNPAFLLDPCELHDEFRAWELLHYDEAKRLDPETGRGRRRAAEIIARRPGRVVLS